MNSNGTTIGHMNNVSSAKQKSTGERARNLFIFFCVALTAGAYVMVSPPVLESIGVFRGILFYPDKRDYDTSTIKSQLEQVYKGQVQDVTFAASDGAKLHGYLCTRQGAKKVVLYSHGNGGNIEGWIVRAYHVMSLGTSVFMYDYEGYGKSEGSPTLATVCDDGVCAYDYLIAHGYKPGDIILLGESFGSGVSCELLKKRTCAGIMIVSGFASLIATGKDKIKYLSLYPDFVFPQPSMNNLEILSGEHPPLLIAHGQNDGILDHSYAEALAKGASEPKTFLSLPDVDHGAVLINDVFLRAAKKFIAGLP